VFNLIHKFMICVAQWLHQPLTVFLQKVDCSEGFKIDTYYGMIAESWNRGMNRFGHC
jgi:hypothetical protein